MQIEQFVMAYEAEQDRLRALLPEGFVSLRPVLRINAEIRNGNEGYVEFNTPVERDGVRGWLNIGFWKGVPFAKQGSITVFQTDFLKIQFTGTGIEGGCPAEKDDAGCFFGKSHSAAKGPDHSQSKRVLRLSLCLEICGKGCSWGKYRIPS